MSSETTVCPGCDNTFTLWEYQSHIAQSNDPLCSAVFDKLKKAYKTQATDSTDEAEAPAFQGDAFGSAGEYTQDLDRNFPVMSTFLKNIMAHAQTSQTLKMNMVRTLRSWRIAGNHPKKELLIN